MKSYSVPISKEDHLFAYFLVWEVSSTASFEKHNYCTFTYIIRLSGE